jgi:hypothetical protein
MENTKKLGRPITAHWRYKENGKYYDSFKDKEQYLEYHKNYWREHSRIPWTCEYCNKTLQVSDHKKRHWNTKSCLSVREEAAS